MLVFVSYCLRDLSLVKSLILQLGVLGHNVQYESKMPGGQTRWTQIMEGIEACDVFILGVTDHSIISESRQLELQYARQLGKPVVMVLLSKMRSDLPPEFAPALDYTARNVQRGPAMARALNTLPEKIPPTSTVVPDWRALLLKLRRHIKAPQLTTANQQMIILNLQELLERRETFRGAQSLLKLLSARRSLDQKARSKIQQIIKQVRQSRARQTRARWRNIALIGLVVLAIATVPLFLAFRKARTDAAAQTQMYIATMSGTPSGPTATTVTLTPVPEEDESTETPVLTLPVTQTRANPATLSPESPTAVDSDATRVPATRPVSPVTRTAVDDDITPRPTRTPTLIPPATFVLTSASETPAASIASTDEP